MTSPVVRSKVELPEGGHLPGPAEAQLEISHQIAYYRAEPHHSALRYHWPNRFETHLQLTSRLYPT